MPALRRRSRLLVCFAVLGLTAVSTAAAQPPSRPSDADTTKALLAYLTDRAAEGLSGVVLVARGDRVLLERGFGYLDAARTRRVAADSVFTTGSITKQFTAAAILKLEMLGRLSTTDPLSQFLPDVPADKRDVTLHHLLTHTAGLPPVSGDDLAPIGRDAFVREVLAAPLTQPLGQFSYSNVGYSLLAAVIERVSGEPYEAFLAQHLFAPAGMRDTGYSRPRWAAERLAHGVNDDGTDRGTFGEVALPNGSPGWHLLGNGGLLSTARDMFRWHQALAGTRVLGAAVKAKIFRGWVEEGGGASYGYGWSMEDTPFGRLVTHNGGNPYFFADFLRYTDSGVTVYYATNSRDPATRRLGRPLAQIAHTGRVLDRPSRVFGAAPEGSTAAQLARTFLQTVAADAATRRARVPELFSAGLIERRGVDALAGFLARVNQDLEGADLGAIEVSAAPDGTVQAVRISLSGRGGRRSLMLMLTGPPVRIDGIELEAGA